MKTAAWISPIAWLLLVGTAGADLCQFGYADAVIVGDGAPTVGWVDAWNAGVLQDSGRIIPLDGAVKAHKRDIRSYIFGMNNSGIRPFVDITDVVWKAEPDVNGNCGSQYERGDLRETMALSRQGLKASYQTKLDHFLSLNASMLGTANIRGFIVHVEVNNNCVPPGRVNTVARGLEERGYGPDQGYAVAAGYGLTYTELPGLSIVSTGMPTNLFPIELTHITPWSYDIHTLFVDSIYNLNTEVAQLGRVGFWNKLVGKLRSGQQVIWGMTALCERLQEEMFNGSHLAPQDRLGTDCTPLPSVGTTWPLASVAEHWRWFAEQQPRIDGLIAISWTGPSGTNALHQVVTDAHILNGNSALTCE